MAIQMSGVIDPRTPLQKLGRFALREILLNDGKKISPDATSDRMRRMIEDENVNLDQFFVRTVHGHIVPNQKAINEIARQRRRDMRAEKAEAITAPSIVAEDPNPMDEIEQLKMGELRQLCKKLGIKGLPTDKKDDLIRKIKDGSVPT